jgi:hypothetical protein
MNKPFNQLLEEEFDRVRANENDAERYRTVRDMAAFWEIDPTLLSRYRKGERPVSRAHAKRLALKFRSDPSEQEALIERILTTHGAEHSTEVEVRKWFERNGHERFLMLVLFYEPPALTSQSELIEMVAQSVVNGLCYGVCFPYSERDLASTQFPVPLTQYLLEVWSRVQELYGSLLRRIFEIERDNNSNLAPADLEKALEKAAKRLRLYKVKDSNNPYPESYIPAVGYRLFYCRNFPLDDSPSVPQLWQWNTSSNGVTMLQRTTGKLEIDAVEAALYPIVQRFESDSHSLPQNGDLNKQFNSDGSLRRARRAPAILRWEESNLDEAVAAIKEILEDGAKDTKNE